MITDWTSRCLSDLNLYIDPALLMNKWKEIKTDIDLHACVCMIGPSEFNKQCFYMEIVWLESQEYTGRRELGLESIHLPWRILTTLLENSAHNPREFGSIFGEFSLLFSSPVGSLCHTHGVVRRPSCVVCVHHNYKK